MSDSISLTWQLATRAQAEQVANEILDASWQQVRPLFHCALAEFLISRLNASLLYRLELMLMSALLALGREILQAALNALEPLSPEDVPHDVIFNGCGYRRMKNKTRNNYVATLFGTITLLRRGYRDWHRDLAEPMIFPLEMLLGLKHGATPAITERIGWLMAAAGSCQKRTIEALRQQHELFIGEERLRQIVATLSAGMEECRQETQVEHLTRYLHMAGKSTGNRLPVMAVGRDGVTLREYVKGCFEVASVATISVFDRSGKRLTTIYLANTPESLQTSTSNQLTELLNAFFRQWTGKLPRLAYVTDSGDNETGFFDQRLRGMRHPVTGELLVWQRVADFYHTMERVWAMATILFPDEKQRLAWGHRMRKLLKKKSGPRRVLQSAASHFHRQNLSKAAQKEFWKAYNYIRSRTRYMDYYRYRDLHIPRGSGVTEAACKSIVTQRLKLSGMRWKKAGAQAILYLRIHVLSRTWSDAYAKYLTTVDPVSMRTYARHERQSYQIAA